MAAYGCILPIPTKDGTLLSATGPCSHARLRCLNYGPGCSRPFLEPRPHRVHGCQSLPMEPLNVVEVQIRSHDRSLKLRSRNQDYVSLVGLASSGPRELTVCDEHGYDSLASLSVGQVP